MTYLAELGDFLRQIVVLRVDAFLDVIREFFMAHGRRIDAYDLGTRGQNLSSVL